jgi:hypothetical protein
MDDVKIKLQNLMVLPFMLFVVAPMTLYYGNLEDIDFTLSDVSGPIIGIFIAISAALFLLQLIVYKIKTARLFFNGLIVGLAVCVWLQSQIMVWNFGPLDGRGLDRQHWLGHGLIELVVWFLVISVCIYISIFKEKALYAIIRICMFVGVGSCLLSYITAPSFDTKRTTTETESGSVFQFHPKNNVIVIMLDTFQSNYFELISEEFPNEVLFLDGFTFYRNTIGMYPTTRPSIPTIMTGLYFDNQVPFEEYERKAYNAYNLPEAFKDKGFSSKYLSMRNFSDILKQNSYSAVPSWTYFVDYGLLRSLPTNFKKHIYNDGRWLVSYYLRNQYPPDYHGRDVQFLELFEKETRVVDDSNGTFRFFHFYIPHFPLLVNEQLRYDPDLSGSKGYTRQARGALKLAQRIIEKLHELNIYDASEIVIMSDHGTGNMPPINAIGDSSADIILRNIPPRVQASALGLFLHKRPGARGSLVINDAPLYLHDLSCILGVVNLESSCKSFHAAIDTGKRERRFMFYSWKHEYWQRDFMPTMTEYFIDGHAYDLNSWRLGDYTYETGSKKRIQRFFAQIGESILFSEYGLSEFIVGYGWGGQEKNHRWTNGPRAGSLIRFHDQPGKDLLLRLKASAYLGGGLTHQTIGVNVNGQDVATWKMRGLDWYEADIPIGLVGEDRLLKVVFNISDPKSPAEVSASTDTRKLGIAARELVILEK